MWGVRCAGAPPPPDLEKRRHVYWPRGDVFVYVCPIVNELQRPDCCSVRFAVVDYIYRVSDTVFAWWGAGSEHPQLLGSVSSKHIRRSLSAQLQVYFWRSHGVLRPPFCYLERPTWRSFYVCLTLMLCGMLAYAALLCRLSSRKQLERETDKKLRDVAAGALKELEDTFSQGLALVAEDREHSGIKPQADRGKDSSGVYYSVKTVAVRHGEHSYPPRTFRYRNIMLLLYVCSRR